MKNILILLTVMVLAVFPIFLHHSSGLPEEVLVKTGLPSESNEEPAELFTGADALAEKMIGRINPEYKQWVKPIWEPPSSEIESLLFVLQAVIGAGALFYCLGYIRGRSSGRQGK